MADAVTEEKSKVEEKPEWQKQIDELNKRQAAIEEENKNLTEANDRLRSELATKAAAPVVSATPASLVPAGFAEKYGIPAEAAQELVGLSVNEARKQLHKEWEEREQQKQIQDKVRKDFFESNKDLVGHEDVVRLISSEYQQKNPNVTLGRAMKDVADECRKYLKKTAEAFGGGKSDVPDILPGGGSRDKGGDQGGSEEAVLTPEQEIDDEVKRRRELARKAS